jgi:non-haem dioxygenase in morphine synthesis N-terminal
MGFAYLAGHGIDQGLIDDTFAEAGRFFAWPAERKAEVSVERSPCDRGWFDLGWRTSTPTSRRSRCRRPLRRRLPGPARPGRPGRATGPQRGRPWIDTKPVPGTFVVNVGDVLARWTNDLFPRPCPIWTRRSWIRNDPRRDLLLGGVPAMTSPVPAAGALC